MSGEKKSLFDLLNSPLSLLAAGFLLTTLVGSYINNAFHEEAWKSKAKFEIFKERLKEAGETQDSIIALSNKRIFLFRKNLFRAKGESTTVCQRDMEGVFSYC